MGQLFEYQDHKTPVKWTIFFFFKIKFIDQTNDHHKLFNIE